MRIRGTQAVWLLLAVAVCLSRVCLAADPSPEDLEFFEKKIRPILVEQCQKCHGPDMQKGNFRLDSREGLFKGGDNGSPVEPGKPDESLLVEAIRYEGDIKMPPKAKLSDEQIANLTEWVKRGAAWPKETPPGVGSKKGEFNLAKRKAAQWAFQAVKSRTPPDVKSPAWARSPVDRFILAKLDSAGLSPAKPADKRTLLRRVTFDLIGLPPTPDELDAFLKDDSPQAFEKIVNRLLDSPHYGERWARHWLDLVRFAETSGHEFDFEIPFAFEYRDYVIRALNADVPYDQFVMEHVAGDLLPNPRRHPTEKFNESIIGTGFWHLGEAKHSPVDVRADEADKMDNQIDVFGKTFLACTLGCARCHDHKFDAISTKDYYALKGFLQSSRFQIACVDPPEPRDDIIAALEKNRSSQWDVLKQVCASGDRLPVSRLAEYLLAVLEVQRGTIADAAPGKKREVVSTVAQSLQLEPSQLESWIAYMTETAAKQPDDPFHLWVDLANLRDKLSSDRFARFKAEQIAALKAQAERAKAERDRVEVLEMFPSNSFGNWFVTGEAFGSAPLRSPFVPLLGSPQGVLPNVIGGGLAHSGVISNRLQGTLRSPTFTITKPRILIHAAGANSKIRLILDGLRLIQNPIYGGLAITVEKSDRLQWYAIDVSKWAGHNAYLEFIDDAGGFIAFDQILFADGNPPTDAPSPAILSLLENQKTDSPEALASEYEKLVRLGFESLFAPARPAGGDAELRVDPGIVAWLTTGNLPGSLAYILANSRQESREKLSQLDVARKQLESRIAYMRKVSAMVDGTSEDDRVHIRGNANKFGDVVPRRFMEAIAGADQPPLAHGSGRLELARRVVDPTNPLLARVMVNRLWKHHFGDGLVRTPDDFGNMGQPPTHPELLDWLAAEFVRRGWSIKEMHRQMLLSATYQMSSRADDARAEELDPQNKLLHRANLRRLEGEIIRDAILAVSGRLDRKLFGPGVPPYLTPFMSGRGRPGQSGPLDGDGRRSVYINVRRNFLTPMFLAFDAPIPFSTMGRRSVSNVPAQALALMNNPFVLQQAEVWAKRGVLHQTDPAARISAMYLSAFSRPPTSEELAAAQAFVEDQSKQYAPADQIRAWTDLAHVLLNVKEFIFVE